MKALGAGAAVPTLEKRRHRVGVRSSRQACVDGERAACFKISELQIASVRELDLLATENLEQHDFVTPPRRPLELRPRPLFIIVKIGQDEQQPPTRQSLRRPA